MKTLTAWMLMAHMCVIVELATPEMEPSVKTLMNVQTTRAIIMQAVLTTKVHLSVNAMLDFLEMG